MKKGGVLVGKSKNISHKVPNVSNLQIVLPKKTSAASNTLKSLI